MRFHHHVPAERLTEDYRLRLLNGMQSNGPLGKVYLRVASGEIAQPVRHFWLKELLYTIKDGILLPVSDEVDKPRDLRRMLRNIRYLVSERSRYDAAVNQVLAYKSQW